MLAGPGVLLGAFAVGGLTQIMLPYGWSFYLSMTLGSVLATTDTAAVVAILNEVNGSPKVIIYCRGYFNFPTVDLCFVMAVNHDVGRGIHA